MKIVTVLGTRPEIIRLSRLIPLLDAHAGHVLVHTGQNSAASLSDQFFAELGLRAPDHNLGVVEPDFARQIGRIMAACHDLLLAERPDRLLVLGDTNSAFAAVVARRLGIPVFHMEAGNRCFDPRVPEEVNRRIIDHSSDVLMPYTERSRQNLLREGFAPERVHVTGNPIHEVMWAHADRIAEALVREGLAACVNVIPAVKSFYVWSGELQRDEESTLFVKTTSARMKALTERVLALHPYDLPEVIAVPLELREGNPAYLRWVTDRVRR